MKQSLQWRLSHSPQKNGPGLQSIEATVPGAVQLDYARALDYEPYYYGLNFRQFHWMEDEYFFYDAPLDFSCGAGERALLHFAGIDYQYEISIDGKVLKAGEGAFTPAVLDVTAFAGEKHDLRVTVFPIPKRTEEPNRSQASACCKPPSSYSWDWHPRLVPSGIWEEVYLDILAAGAPRFLESRYVLSDDRSQVTVSAQVKAFGDGTFTATLSDPRGRAVASQSKCAKDGETVEFTLALDEPQLWYPRGYGDQPIYTLQVAGSDTVSRKLGFRRSRLIYSETSNLQLTGPFPKGPIPAPMQLEVNGKKVFAKGSNWVNTEIFPCLATNERYDELIKLAYDANMNIFRMWGGQYINHEYFYDKCDELGILVWQEFMLSCNSYPDSDDYLAVLEQEATSIIKRLRTHPCIAFWCGGNELFNSWSGMDPQSHALRLLDKLCFTLDRYTPFNMTSPLHGVGHGSYLKVLFNREGEGREFLCDVKDSKRTAYTEFGCNGGATREYILKYIMDEENFRDCNEDNPIWKAHHAFRAWTPSAWLGIPEVVYYYGGYDSVEDMLNKSLHLQDICYKTMFEEMRRQAPLCSMAINWDFNEPWPCAAGNALVNWPAEPKTALTAVKEALRDTLVSLELPRNRYLTGDSVTGTVWVLNDSSEPLPAEQVRIYLVSGDAKRCLGTVETAPVEPYTNGSFGTFTLTVTEDIPADFTLTLETARHPAWDSSYDLVHNRGAAAQGIREDSNDFSDFLK